MTDRLRRDRSSHSDRDRRYLHTLSLSLFPPFLLHIKPSESRILNITQCDLVLLREIPLVERHQLVYNEQ